MRNTRVTKVVAGAIVLLAVTGGSRDVNARSINIPEVNSHVTQTQFFQMTSFIPVSTLETNEQISDEQKRSNQDDDYDDFNPLDHRSTMAIMLSGEDELEEEIEQTAEGTTEENISLPYTDEEKLLATVIHAEAGICDDHEKFLVGSVVLNRVDSSNFPNTIADVIYQKDQFTSVNGRAWREETPTESEHEIARKLIEGYRECPSNVVFFSKRCDFGTQYTKTEWHEYGAE